MSPKRIAFYAAALAVVAGAYFCEPYFKFYRRTGSVFPRYHIEKLKTPIGVTGWNADGLILADGRTHVILGISDLPKVSEALTAVTSSGVEIDAAGNVTGLIRLWHWCGNDPMREHIVRIDVGRFLTYMDVGKSSLPSGHEAFRNGDPQAYLHPKFGWNVSGAHQYFNWY